VWRGHCEREGLLSGVKKARRGWMMKRKEGIDNGAKMQGQGSLCCVAVSRELDVRSGCLKWQVPERRSRWMDE